MLHQEKQPHMMNNTRFTMARRGRKKNSKLTAKQSIDLNRRFPKLDTPNYALRAKEDRSFENRSSEWGFDSNQISQGMAVADLDNDGDQDVVCCSLISRPLDGVSIEDLDSVIWLEQTGEGDFIPRSLEKGNCNHATIVVDDFDQDGDLDIATAQFEDTRLSKYSDIAIWWNNSIIPSQESTKNNP